MSGGSRRKVQRKPSVIGVSPFLWLVILLLDAVFGQYCLFGFVFYVCCVHVCFVACLGFRLGVKAMHYSKSFCVLLALFYLSFFFCQVSKATYQSVKRDLLKCRKRVPC